MFKKAFFSLATVCLLALGGTQEASADHWGGGCRHHGWGGGYGYGRPFVQPYGYGGGFYRGPAFYRSPGFYGGGFHGGPRFYGPGVRGGLWIGF